MARLPKPVAPLHRRRKIVLARSLLRLPRSQTLRSLILTPLVRRVRRSRPLKRRLSAGVQHHHPLRRGNHRFEHRPFR